MPADDAWQALPQQLKRQEDNPVDRSDEDNDERKHQGRQAENRGCGNRAPSCEPPQIFSFGIPPGFTPYPKGQEKEAEQRYQGHQRRQSGWKCGHPDRPIAQGRDKPPDQQQNALSRARQSSDQGEGRRQFQRRRLVPIALVPILRHRINRAERGGDGMVASGIRLLHRAEGLRDADASGILPAERLEPAEEAALASAVLAASGVFSVVEPAAEVAAANVTMETLHFGRYSVV